MANEKKKVTNTSNKNKKTTTKKSTTTKKVSAKKSEPKKTVTAKKETSKKVANAKATAVKTAPKKKTTTTKKNTTVTTKKAAKKVANNTKNATKKIVTKKNVKKQTPKKVEPKKIEKKVEVVKEEPKKVEKIEKVASKETERKITLSTSTIYTIVGLAVLAIVIILSICINPSSGKYDENNTGTTGTTTTNSGSPASGGEEIPDDKRKELTSISIDEYLEKLKGEEASVIYIGRPTCGHCVAQKPIMENIAFEYDVTINYLNTDELDEDGINKLVSSNDYFSEGFGTPLTLIVRNNEIVDKAVGETSKTDMVNMFKNNSIIK